MNINYLIELLTNRLTSLRLAKDQAFSAGDLERINTLETEIFGVEDTLAKLNLLQSVSQDVALTNTTLVEAMKMQANVISNGSTACMSEYDISTYATDPLHEQKIADILSFMGPMISPEVIDAYIDTEAIASPLTGAMILSAAQQYNIDVRLMMALMELDSRFGTAGVAIDTMNPGNVGNTGTAIRYYASWQEGVTAVAEWLSRHRIINQVEETVVVEEVVNKPPENENIIEEEVEVEEVIIPETKPEQIIITPEDNLSASKQTTDIKLKKVNKIK